MFYLLYTVAWCHCVSSPHLKRMKSRTRAFCRARYCPTVYWGSNRKLWGKRRVSDSPHGTSPTSPRLRGASPTTCCPSFLPSTSSCPSGPPWNTTRAPYRPIGMPVRPNTAPCTYDPTRQSVGTPTDTARLSEMFSPRRPERQTGRGRETERERDRDRQVS